MTDPIGRTENTDTTILIELRRLAHETRFPVNEPVLVQELAQRLGVPTERVERVAALDANQPTGEALFNPRGFQATRFRGKKPPQRRMLIDEFLPLDIAAVLAGMGGSGKGFLQLQLGASIASGVPFLDMPVGYIGGVAILSAEDDEDELHRRFAAVVKHYTQLRPSVDTAALHERMVLVPRVGQVNLLTALSQGGNVERTQLVTKLIAALKQVPDLRIVMLDPLSRFQGGRINAEEDATRFVEVAEEIRGETGGCALISAHVGKGAGKDREEQDVIRGSSALVDGFRWGAIMQPLRAKDADKYDIDPAERRRYVRLDLVKTNYTRPWPGLWLRRETDGVLVPTQLERVPDGTSAKDDEERDAIITRFKGLVLTHGAQSTRTIEKQWASRTGPLRAGRVKVMGALAHGVQNGVLTRFTGYTQRSDGATTKTLLWGVPEQQPKAYEA